MKCTNITQMRFFSCLKKNQPFLEKKSAQIKCLQAENRSYKKSIGELRDTNEELRLKVQNLKEEDINKRILNFAIEENRGLECKIKIQKERNVMLGLDFKEQSEKLNQLEVENKQLKEKLLSLKKLENSDSKL